MGEMSISVLSHILLFLSFPLIFGYLALRSKLPAIVGYILGGIVLGLLVQKELTEVVSLFANFGLLLLLFTIGLELNLESLYRFKRFVVLGGLLQVGLVVIFSTIASILFGFSPNISILLGIGFAFSSTAIVSKIIQEKGEENTLVGQLSIGILIFQDILVIPTIVILTSIHGNIGAQLVISLIVSIIKSALIIVTVYIIGELLIPYMFRKIGKRSRELLNLFTIFLIFTIVYTFSLIGLSSTLAAFITGIMVGQTLEHYHIFSQIRPMRDLFTILFFVFLGVSVSVASHINLIIPIVIFTIVLIFIKIIIVLLLFIQFRFHSKSSYSISIYLSQVGEFAFIIFTLALSQNFIGESDYFFAVGVTITSLIISPMLIENKDAIYIFIRNLIKKRVPFLHSYLMYRVDREPAHIEAFAYKNHVVLCGYGRVGLYVARALSMANIMYVAVDFNLHTVEKARKNGVNILYGDPTDIDILDYAQVDHATCLISTVPDKFSQETIILNAKKLNPSITILSRVAKETEQKRMKDLGAYIVVQPEFEAAISIIRKIFTAYNVEKETVGGKIKRLKIEHGMA